MNDHWTIKLRLITTKNKINSEDKNLATLNIKYFEIRYCLNIFPTSFKYPWKNNIIQYLYTSFQILASYFFILQI